MRENYDSFDYWEQLIRENKTLRGHMFMNELPTEKSIYLHTLVFGKQDGLNSQWMYFPNEKALVGYIQYSFFQEAFYRWIHGAEKMIIDIPNIPVQKIIAEAHKDGTISTEEANKMKRQMDIVRNCWGLKKKDLFYNLKKLSREFNKSWQGDSTRFLYLKIFKTAEELGDFVIKSSTITEKDDSIIDKTGIKVDEWKKICKRATLDPSKGIEFREILLKLLSDII